MVQAYPKLSCLTSTGVVCGASNTGDNAVAVSQTATVPTTFLRVFGFNSWTLMATATASAKGGSGNPHNVMLIVDTTKSMTDTDSDSQCNSTRIFMCVGRRPDFAEIALSLSSRAHKLWHGFPHRNRYGWHQCVNAVDEVGLMIFPELTSTSDIPGEYACPRKTRP
jgi:hypothetical protein